MYSENSFSSLYPSESQLSATEVIDSICFCVFLRGYIPGRETHPHALCFSVLSVYLRAGPNKESKCLIFSNFLIMKIFKH